MTSIVQEQGNGISLNHYCCNNLGILPSALNCCPPLKTRRDNLRNSKSNFNAYILYPNIYSHGQFTNCILVIIIPTAQLYCLVAETLTTSTVQVATYRYISFIALSFASLQPLYSSSTGTNLHCNIMIISTIFYSCYLRCVNTCVPQAGALTNWATYYSYS